MKKIISLLLALLIMVSALFTFASCSKQELNFGKEYSNLSSQLDVLIQLNTNSVDVGVMDSIMAGYYMSQDATYSNRLMIVENLTLATEQYGIAARKGSGLTKKINEALVALANDGVVNTLAAKYGIESELCIDKTITVEPLTDAEKSDWEYIKSQGKFIVGYTIFAPIAYKTDSGELIGFDIELAKAVANYLEISVDFEKIEWSAKEALLEAKTIDCIWNGMTITDERVEKMEVSIPYLNNKQVAVIRKADAQKYTDTSSMSEAIVAAEKGSAGESCIVKSDK